MSELVAEDAGWTAPLLALMGPQLGGIVLSPNSETSWCEAYVQYTPQENAMRAVPSSITPEQITGALDLAATLATGKSVMQTGLLHKDANPVLLIRRASRLESVCVALLGHGIDQSQLMLAVTDDSLDGEDAVSAILKERLAFEVDVAVETACGNDTVNMARSLLPHVSIADSWVDALCSACLALGVASPRAAVLAVFAAKGLAALTGRADVNEEDVTRAARLVLAHRATRLPNQLEQQQENATPQTEQADKQDAANSTQKPANSEILVAAVKAALPVNVLQSLSTLQGRKAAARNRSEQSKKALAAQKGRVTGTMRASNLSRQRLNVLATLRIAAPWQVLRRRDNMDRLVVLRDDLRVSRRKQRTEATAIFAVDASGSTAFQRLAEAKGAIETLLSECYVRRDRVAMIAFRGKMSEVLLPPTRSVERARRALTALAGGGGTPMASALDQAFAIADQVKRGGGKPIVILLTDGRANVTRTGEGNKLKAVAETEEAAKRFAIEGYEAMVMDVSPEPQKSARLLAANLTARYLHLPRARAAELAAPVRAALKDAVR